MGPWDSLWIIRASLGSVRVTGANWGYYGQWGIIMGQWVRWGLVALIGGHWGAMRNTYTPSPEKKR